jgi:hypothetical protein
MTSLTSYETVNSIQKDKGECQKARDQWVFREKDCHKDYPFFKNTGSDAETAFS